jgi:cytochrome c553
MRNRWLRPLAWTVGILLGTVGIAVLALHVYTEGMLRTPPGPALAELTPGDAAEGARLAQVLGCTACHGMELGGAIFMEIPFTGRVVAPNLTQVRERYDDAGLQRVLRAGIKADGRMALMPNKAFQRLTDAQVAHLIAYLRAAPPVQNELPRSWLGPLVRLGVVLGQYDVESLRPDPPESSEVLADRNHSERGRHLAQVVCGECHGMDFRGFPADGTPPLEVVRSYSHEEFTRLMREGVTPSGGETASGFMSGVARYRFTALTDEEIAAIKAYFDTTVR